MSMDRGIPQRVCNASIRCLREIVSEMCSEAAAIDLGDNASIRVITIYEQSITALVNDLGYSMPFIIMVVNYPVVWIPVYDQFPWPS